MPRKSKYTDPIDRKLANNQHMLRKQYECRTEALKLLGGKCAACGNSDLDVLEMVSPFAIINWIEKLRAVKADIRPFKCLCANCNAKSKMEAVWQDMKATDEKLLTAIGWDVRTGQTTTEDEEPIKNEPAKDELSQDQISDSLEKAKIKMQEELDRKQREWEERDKKYRIPSPLPAQIRANAENPLDVYTKSIPIPAR